MFDTKNKKIAWGALAGLILILLLLPGPKKIGVEAPVTEAPEPTVATAPVEEEKDAYTIDAEYPQLENLADDGLELDVNDAIKKEVLDSIAAFKRETSGGEGSDLQLRYEVAYRNAAIFSVALNYSTYTDGAAHPFNYIVTMTFDLRTGEQVELRDLFLDGADYLPVLADAAKKELEERFPSVEGERVWDEEGAAPTAANYEEFLISPEGLVVVFNPYQVAAYAAGVQRITVPYAALAELIDPSGILTAR